MKLLFSLLLANFSLGVAYTQYDGAVGTPGCKAVYKESPLFLDWASSCTIEYGAQNIKSPASGTVQTKLASNALGKAAGTVVSLGDSGVATLTFDSPIYDGPGADFAVFENAFDDKFLELAFVEVSSDGSRFVRFPAVSLLDTSVQIGAFDKKGDPTKLYNLAGKYRSGYGTPFDLSELSDSTGIDLTKITHVRIVDVIGCIDSTYASFDKNGRAINDPFPTAFSTGGFDLDAVGVINRKYKVGTTQLAINTFNIYPNPIHSGQTLHLNINTENYKGYVYNLTTGALVATLKEANISTIDWPRGLYVIEIEFPHSVVRRKFLIQE